MTTASEITPVFRESELVATRLEAIPTPTPADATAGPRADAYLVQIYPANGNFCRRYPLGPGPIHLGRDHTTIPIPDDPAVSRTHAQVARQPDGGYLVSDLKSTNGTYLNDVPLTTGPLRSGDALRVGDTVFRFLSGRDVESRYVEEVRQLTVTDPSTGLPNRQSLAEALARETGRSGTRMHPLVLTLAGVDHLRGIETGLGRYGGNVVLRAVAERIRPVIGRRGLLARYGEAEVAVLFPGASPGRAVILGERVRRMTSERPLEINGRTYALTASVGVVSWKPGDRGGHDELLLRAAARLTDAQRTGGNRVCA
jgi:diguanylate cyclase (GGDEF)-like protein